MPFQGGRYLPPIATPILSTYQKDFITQDVDPPKSYKYRSTSSLPPINYSRHREEADTIYKDEFQGTFGLPALSAKPAAYNYPSMDPFETSTYRANFGRSTNPREKTIPTSPFRKNNPHPRTMNNAFIFPNRGYWVWPHKLRPLKFE
ncbi:uncharacterized protein [Montipora foliosa]|uniref:uncharacterized protein n=1 Tax=Montipora foliosa TaxID=591990 RepID=UPI0035F1D0EB